MSYSNKGDKYCVNPFKLHGCKRKDLRDVTREQAIKHPSLVSTGQKICSQCRKELSKRPKESTEDVQEPFSMESLSSDEGASGAEAIGMSESELFSSPEASLQDINQSLGIIGVSPLKKHKAKTNASYLKQKKQRVQETLSEKFDAACGSTAYDSDKHPEDKDLEPEKIVQSLIRKYKISESRAEKMTILTIFAPTWTRKKMIEILGCSQRMAVSAKKLAAEKGILTTPNPKVGKSLPRDVNEAVEEFYYRDDISRPMPGKKDCLTVYKNGEKIKAQKRLVLGNLKETYRQFKDTYPDKKIGFSKFALLRPKECILAGSGGTHSVCVCTIHNNVKLMMNGSNLAEVTADLDVPLKHYSNAIDMITCNPALPFCHFGNCDVCPDKDSFKQVLIDCFEEAQIDEIEYKQWTSTDRSNLETTIQTVEVFLDNFMTKLEVLRQHDFIAKQQASYLQSKKQSLEDGEFLIIGDFSENYSFIVQDAAQSFHWNNSMATIHPFVFYFRDNETIKHDNFVLISDCNVHDTVAVHLFQKRLILHLKRNFENVRNLIYFSDGCAGQYKNLKNFLNLCLHEDDFGVRAEWHFFATSHGKGPSDGIGGTIKREAARASLQRPSKDQILTPWQLFQFVQANLKGVNAEFITCDEWNTEQSVLKERFLMAKTIPGTQKLHSFKPVSRSSIQVTEFSASASSRLVSVVKQDSQPLDDGIITGYVAVAYDNEWWLAYVHEAYPERNELSVNFLHPHGPSPSYVYPHNPDNLVIDKTDVLTKLSPTTITGRTYTLSRSDTLKASDKMGQKQH